jgi:hypothetical protein
MLKAVPQRRLVNPCGDAITHEGCEVVLESPVGTEAVDSINDVFRIVRNVHRNAGDEKQIRSNTFSKGTLQLSNTTVESFAVTLFVLFVLKR